MRQSMFPARPVTASSTSGRSAEINPSSIEFGGAVPGRSAIGSEARPCWRPPGAPTDATTSPEPRANNHGESSMPPAFEQLVGALLLLMTLLDVFLTVLYARAGTGIISYKLARLIWWIFGAASGLSGRHRGAALSFCGPMILVSLVLIWALGLTLGAAMILHPELGGTIRADSGETPTGFLTAVYVAGSSMSIVGSSGFSPKSDGFRMLF